MAAEGQAVVAATAKTVLDADAKRAGDLKSLKDNLHSGMLQISQARNSGAVLAQFLRNSCAIPAQFF